MKKGVSRLLLITLLLFAHLLLFGKPLSFRLGMKPLSVFPYGSDTQEQNPVLDSENGDPIEEAHAFVAPRQAGFFLEDGTLISAFPRDELLSISELGAIVSFSSGEDTLRGFFTPRQVLKGIVPDAGLPYLTDHGVYQFSRDRRKVAEYSMDGQLLWEKGFNGMISCFADLPDRRLIGTVQGEVVLLDSSGVIAHRFTLPGGKARALYGLALDSRGQRIALLHGAVDQTEPQRLSLWERGDRTWQFAAEWDMPVRRFRETAVEFLNNSRVIRIEGDGVLLTLDILSGRVEKCEIPGYYLGGGSFPSIPVSFAVTESREGALMLVHESGEHLVSFPFGEKPWFFRQMGDVVYVGLDSAIGVVEFGRY